MVSRPGRPANHRQSFDMRVWMLLWAIDAASQVRLSKTLIFWHKKRLRVFFFASTSLAFNFGGKKRLSVKWHYVVYCRAPGRRGAGVHLILTSILDRELFFWTIGFNDIINLRHLEFLKKISSLNQWRKPQWYLIIINAIKWFGFLNFCLPIDQCAATL